MRMIPSAISQLTESDAERRVFELLKSTDLGMESRAFHSLNLAEHEYKRVGELDFVVLTAHAVIVLEVKGGGVSCQGGIWRFKDRFGIEHRRSEGPFQQARSGMFALEQRLAREVGTETVDRFVFGYGVIFTDALFHIRSVEWSDEMVVDVDELRGHSDLGTFIERLTRYWKQKGRAPRGEVDPAALGRIAAVLRPEFDRVPSLRHRADMLDLTTERLTHEQYSRLDLIDDNPRILVSGGAGTGKTFLATELARRHSTGGDRVLLVTSGPMLEAFTRTRVGRKGVTVSSMETLGERLERFDVLIVDEGQDMMNFTDLDKLDGLLVGGLAGGRWRIFFDANKQIGLTGRFEPESIELLRSYGAVSASLRINCRNTRQITTHTRLLTAADLGTPSAGDGPKVGISYFNTEAGAAALLDAELSRLMEQGVPRGEITILSPGLISSSCARLTEAYSRGFIHEMDLDMAAAWPTDDITFATIADFKGLENRFVLLVDVRALDESERDVNLLYVAMSRARAVLWISVERGLARRMDEIARSNLPRVVEDLRLTATSEEFA